MDIQFRIKVRVEPVNDLKPEDFPDDPRRCAYRGCNKDVHTWDRIFFKLNNIYIYGSRKENIRANTLYTIRSTQYFEMLRACMYYFYTWGGFEITSIEFYIYDNSGEIRNHQLIKDDDIAQNFMVTHKDKFDSKILNSLFEIKNEQNDLSTVLIYHVQGYKPNRFEDTWREFNHIYNAISKSNADLNSIEKLLKDKHDVLCEDHDLLSMSKNFIDNLNDTRIIYWFSFDHDDVCRFESKSKIHTYSDKNLIIKLQNICNRLYSKNILKQEKPQRRVYKSIMKLSEDHENNFDYLRILLYYAYFQRNKYFHGVFPDRLILKDNDVKNELEQLNNTIRRLNYDLIKNEAPMLMRE